MEEACQQQLPDWAGLPTDLLELVFEQLSSQAHAHAGGPVSVAQAAGLLAAASPCRRWRRAALAKARCGQRHPLAVAVAVQQKEALGRDAVPRP